MDFRTRNRSIKGVRRLNVLLGRNGTGKSTVLREIEEERRGISNEGIVRYISPERGGHLRYEPSIENNVINNAGWFRETRRANQFNQFKQQSLVQYRKLEALVSRELETWVKSLQDGEKEISRGREGKLFDKYIASLNELLENIELRRTSGSFETYPKGANDLILPERISSGESELISLAIECLAFEKECDATKTNILLIDEPDVHLHPDLQARFMRLLVDLLKTKKFVVLMATHSTAILGAISDYEDVGVAFMASRHAEVVFENISDIYRTVLPVFGAHPLSSIFNEAPIFLVEGEDDERIWQQAVRSSEGKLRIYPAPVGTKDRLNAFEEKARDILKAVYENAKGYSLRDRDDAPYEIDDLPPVQRFRLACREGENLLLADEVLGSLGTSWEKLREGIENWITQNPEHGHYADMLAFRDGGYQRQNAKVKELANDLMGIIGRSKAWEVAVGQAIGGIFSGRIPVRQDLHTIATFLGPKLLKALMP